MRSKKGKIAVIAALVFCMIVSAVVVFGLNSTAKCPTSGETCKAHFTKFSAEDAAAYYNDNNDGVSTYPTEKGYLFAGWYKAEEATEANALGRAVPTTDVYAYFVPDHMLSVKAQASGNLIDDNANNDDKADLRFITTVDSLLYSQVGFDISYTSGGKTYAANVQTNTVYPALYEIGSNSNPAKITPEGSFCNMSTFFMTYTLNNVPKSMYNVDFTIKPYFITMDGEKVYGPEAAKSVDDAVKRDLAWVDYTVGKDAYTEGTEEAPYKTVAYAKEHITEGGEIWVRNAFADVTDAAELEKGTIFCDINLETYELNPAYKLGEEVVIWVMSNDITSYACNSLMVGDESVAIDGTGYYKFKPDKEYYEVAATYADPIYDYGDNSDWFLEGQLFGNLTYVDDGAVNSNNQAESTALWTKDNTYREFEVKTQHKNPGTKGFSTQLDFKFTSTFKNSKGEDVNDYYEIRIQNDDGKYVLQQCKWSNTLGGWSGALYTLSDEEVAKITGEGINFKVAIVGNSAVAYIDGVKRATQNFSKDIGDATAQVGLRTYENKDQTVDFQTFFKKSTVAVEADHGTLTTDKSAYNIGDKVVVTAKADNGYAYETVTLDGTPIALDAKGQYSFTATKADHNIKAVAAKSMFVNNSAWNVNGQHFGGLTVTNGDGKETSKLVAKGNYSSASMTVKYEPGMEDAGGEFTHSISFVLEREVFTTGRYRVIKDKNGWKVQIIGGSSSIFGESNWAGKYLTEAQIAKVTDEGIDFKVVREASDLVVYIDGEEFWRNAMDGVTADTAVREVQMSMNLPAGRTTTTNVTLGNAVITKESDGNGTVAIDKTTAMLGVGEKVTVTTTPNAGYILESITIDGVNVVPDTDGKYTFIATQKKHTVKATFTQNSVWWPDTSTMHWNLEDQYAAEVLTVTNKKDSALSTWMQTKNGNYNSMSSVITDISYAINKENDYGIIQQMCFDTNGDGSLGKGVGFRVFFDHAQNKWRFQSFGNDSNPFGWGHGTDLSAAQIASIKDGGLEFKMVRSGTKLTVYMDGYLFKEFDLTSNDSGITADTPIVYVRYQGITGQDKTVELPYTVGMTTTPSVVDTTNGTFKFDKTAYAINDIAKVTPAPNSGYYLKQFFLDGEEVTDMNEDGTFTFKVTKPDHELKGIYTTESMFDLSGSSWNLSTQHFGYLRIPARDADYSNWMWSKIESDYRELETVVRWREHPEDNVWGYGFNFKASNGKNVTFRIVCEDSVWRLKEMQAFAGSSVLGWADLHILTDAEVAKVKNEGLTVKVVREGTNLKVSLDGVQRATINMAQNSSGITADMKAQVAMTVWGNKGVETVVPFKLSGAKLYVEPNSDATITTNKSTYEIGEMATIKTDPIESWYYLTSLSVDGEELQVDANGDALYKVSDAESYVSASFANGSIWAAFASQYNLEGQYYGYMKSLPHDTGDRAGLWTETRQTFTSIFAKAKYTGLATGNKEFNFYAGLRFNTSGDTYQSAVIRINSTDGTKFKMQISGWPVSGQQWKTWNLNDDQNARMLTEGVEIGLVQRGLVADVYLDGKLAWSDLPLTAAGTDGITEDTLARASVEMDGNPVGETVIQYRLEDKQYDHDLFYKNKVVGNLPDPFILDNTKVDGYYYLYGTNNDFTCYRSKDAMNWTEAGNALLRPEGTEAYHVTWSARWAPEVIYDANEKMYYMFFSASPNEVGSTETSTTMGRMLLMVAKSKYPDRAFEIVNFKDSNSCNGNTHNYSTSTYSAYYAKYLMLDPAQYHAKNTDKNPANYRGGYLSAIDAHPWVDPDTGTKYLFWVSNEYGDRIWVVQMNNWLSPKWRTAKVAVRCNYLATNNSTQPEYELSSVSVNEGPTMLKHNGTYYLTFSVNGYTTNDYKVVQATASSVLGTYTKLTAAQGGVVLSGQDAGATATRGSHGTGHHSILTVGEQMYIVYHRHTDWNSSVHARNYAMDELIWVKNSEGKEVLYANGPTNTLQPAIEANSPYKNIADDGTSAVKVEASGSVSNIEALTDGILSIERGANGMTNNATFMKYVAKECTFSATTTFTITLTTPKEVGAVMIYNSREAAKAFTAVESVVTYDANGNMLDRADQVPFKYLDGDYVEPGSATIVECSSTQKVSKITITINPNGKTVGLSEIRVLAK